MSRTALDRINNLDRSQKIQKTGFNLFPSSSGSGPDQCLHHNSFDLVALIWYIFLTLMAPAVGDCPSHIRAPYPVSIAPGNAGWWFPWAQLGASGTSSATL